MKIKKCTAFTLVECLISILLLAIVLTGGLKMYFYSSEAMTLATHKRIATEMVHNKLEELKNTPYLSIISSGVPENIQIGGLTATRTVTVTQPTPPNYKNVNVTVTWTEAGRVGSRQLSVDTMISP